MNMQTLTRDVYADAVTIAAVTPMSRICYAGKTKNVPQYRVTHMSTTLIFFVECYLCTSMETKYN